MIIQFDGVEMWGDLIEDTEYDIYTTKIHDIIHFIQETVHWSVKLRSSDVPTLVSIEFENPKYETFFRVKYSEYIV